MHDNKVIDLNYQSVANNIEVTFKAIRFSDHSLYMTEHGPGVLGSELNGGYFLGVAMSGYERSGSLSSSPFADVARLTTRTGLRLRPRQCFGCGMSFNPDNFALNGNERREAMLMVFKLQPQDFPVTVELAGGKVLRDLSTP
jgi:hypothetical protein